MTAAVDADVLDVMFACDGRRTLSEDAGRFAERRGMPADSRAHLVIVAVRELLRHGLLDWALGRAPVGDAADPP